MEALLLTVGRLGGCRADCVRPGAGRISFAVRMAPELEAWPMAGKVGPDNRKDNGLIHLVINGVSRPQYPRRQGIGAGVNSDLGNLNAEAVQAHFHGTRPSFPVRDK